MPLDAKDPVVPACAGDRFNYTIRSAGYDFQVIATVLDGLVVGTVYHDFW